MKQTTLKKTILLTVACASLAFAQSVGAARVSEFLDPLASEVAIRLENPEISSAEQKALNSAAKTLNRNAKTFTSELSALSSALKALEKAYPEDEPLGVLANDAVNNYVNEAQGQLDAVRARAGDSEVPSALANAISRAEASIGTANDTDLEISARIKAASKALNDVRVADRLSLRLFKAPLSLDGTVVTLEGKGQFDATLNSDGTYIIADTGNGEETGTWSYQRTSASEGEITLSPTAGDPRALTLKFSNHSKGSFTGGDGLRGKFTVALAM